MRPYLAIIKDSFRGAIASRVLYVLLALITLFLLAIAPFSITETVTTEVSIQNLFPTDVVSGQSDFAPFLRLSEDLVQAGEGNNDSPKKQIWDKLSTETQDDLKERLEEASKIINRPDDAEPDPEVAFFPQRVMNTAERFRDDINSVIASESLYDEDIWKRKQRLGDEANELIDQPVPLTQKQNERLNRILVSKAFSEIDEGLETSLVPGYLFKKWDSVPIRREQLKNQMASWLPFVLDKIVLALGVFIAILVTAPIIPQTFDSGSLNLLLSKPVSRSAMLVSKFIGGSAFVAICAVYLFVGLWLIFGIRLGIWNKAILISIPIYILVFAIYYSVSVSAGVVWRNTIICIVMATLFWLVCFSIGTLDTRLDGGISSRQFVKVDNVDKELIGVDYSGVAYRWDRSTDNWDVAFRDQGAQELQRIVYGMSFFVGAVDLPPPLGPVYLEEYDQVAIGQIKMSSTEVGMMPDLVISTPDNLSKAERVTQLPPGTIALGKDHNGKLLIATRDGTLFRLKTNPLETFLKNRKSAEGTLPGGLPEQVREEVEKLSDKDRASEDSDDADEKPVAGPKRDTENKKPNIFSRLLGVATNDNEYFDELKIDESFVVGPGATMAVNPISGLIAIAGPRNIVILEPDGDGYKVVREDKLESAIRTEVATGGSYLLVARGNGNLLLYDLKEGTLLETFKPESTSVFRSISATNDGTKFAISYMNGNLWIVDSKDRSISKVNVRGQGDISAASFQGDKTLLVIDRINRVTTYNAQDYSRTAVLAPKLSWMTWTFRYVLHPLYVVFPKPGEFYKLIDHLSISRSEEVDRTAAIADQSVRSNPWSPLWSGLGFMVVVLFLACIYFERQEF